MPVGPEPEDETNVSNNDADDDPQAEQDAMSEWMKVMLGEIERKRTEDEEAEQELARRRGDERRTDDDSGRPQ